MKKKDISHEMINQRVERACGSVLPSLYSIVKDRNKEKSQDQACEMTKKLDV